MSTSNNVETLIKQGIKSAIQNHDQNFPQIKFQNNMLPQNTRLGWKLKTLTIEVGWGSMSLERLPTQENPWSCGDRLHWTSGWSHGHHGRHPGWRSGSQKSGSHQVHQSAHPALCGLAGNLHLRNHQRPRRHHQTPMTNLSVETGGWTWPSSSQAWMMSSSSSSSASSARMQRIASGVQTFPWSAPWSFSLL